MSDDLIDDIHADLEADHVYIHPSLADQFTDDQVATLEQEAEQHDTYVVAYPLDRNDRFGGDVEDMLAQLHDHYPVDGLYVASSRYAFDDDTPDLEAVVYGPVDDESFLKYDVMQAVNDTDQPDLGGAFTRTFELLDLPREDVLQIVERQDQARDRGLGSGGGDGDVPVAGFVVGGIVLVIVIALLARAVPSRRDLPAGGPATPAPPRPPAPAPRPRPAVVLPPSAIERIRQAHDRVLLERAESELLALGEAIDAAEITPDSDRVAWQAAIDHYEAGRRLLDQPEPGVMDVIGTVVLAERGTAALGAARAGQPWVPEKPCFLNPLHGRATRTREVSGEGGTLTAPLCRDCDTALDRGTTPDILDVARHGRPVHYFDSTVEPWASTGFGALDDDLVSRLHAGG